MLRVDYLEELMKKADLYPYGKLKVSIYEFAKLLIDECANTAHIEDATETDEYSPFREGQKWSAKMIRLKFGLEKE